MLRRAVELVLVVPVHAQECPKALVDLHLEWLMGVLLAVDGKVAVGRDGLDPVCVRLEIVLLRVTYATIRHQVRTYVGSAVSGMPGTVGSISTTHHRCPILRPTACPIDGLQQG